MSSDLTVVRAAVYLARSAGHYPSRRVVDALIRVVQKRSYNAARLAAMIAKVLAESGATGNQPIPTGNQESLTPEPSRTQTDTNGATRETKTKTGIPSLFSTENNGPPATAAAPAATAKKPRRTRSKRPRKPPPNTAWVAVLEAEIAPLEAGHDYELRALTPAQRLLVGRVHALRFANCTADEGRNRSAGRKIAAGLASMALAATVHDLSVREYFFHAAQAFEMGGRRPFYDAFSVKAAVPAWRMQEAKEAMYG